MHGTRILEEADRLMTVCNSCRYCEGLCAVFPAMEMRRAFSDGDLNYLANLCHGCGACYTDCQFSPPHEFNVNVPKTLAIARAESYAAYAGPRAFWRDIGEPIGALTEPASLWQAMKDAGQLRYLDGGGVGCVNEDERPNDRRKIYHHLTFYGFLLCFAATSVATLYHYLLAREAPYPWWDLPVVLGTSGGIGLLVGPAGLLKERWKRDPALVDEKRTGMDVAFIVMLFMTGLTGMALLLLRDAAAMGPLLALHLGVVFALFITMPYGKFVHGIYRFVALVRYAKEHRALTGKA